MAARLNERAKARKSLPLGETDNPTEAESQVMAEAAGGSDTRSDDESAEKARLLRNQGMRRQFEHVTVGYNYRMSDIQAALGRSQLRRLMSFNAKRRENAQRLSSQLPKSVVPFVDPNGLHVFHHFAIKVKPVARRKLHQPRV